MARKSGSKKRLNASVTGQPIKGQREINQPFYIKCFLLWSVITEYELYLVFEK
ncbi:hypothetical protein [Bacillus rubiinfantis]|uniref:hypothetical protein n=1 Tax=Bacillus rubiinfantis TaxID=1499680 RepID=UPI000AED22BF|nr:hypothetical protein [Bacillus rubiinfantis]